MLVRRRVQLLAYPVDACLLDPAALIHCDSARTPEHLVEPSTIPVDCLAMDDQAFLGERVDSAFVKGHESNVVVDERKANRGFEPSARDQPESEIRGQGLENLTENESLVQ